MYMNGKIIRIQNNFEKLHKNRVFWFQMCLLLSLQYMVFADVQTCITVHQSQESELIPHISLISLANLLKQFSGSTFISTNNFREISVKGKRNKPNNKQKKTTGFLHIQCEINDISIYKM